MDRSEPAMGTTHKTALKVLQDRADFETSRQDYWLEPLGSEAARFLKAFADPGNECALVKLLMLQPVQ